MDCRGLANGSAGRDAHTTILLFEGTVGLRPWLAAVYPMVVRAGMPTLPFYFFEGTVGLHPWIAAVSQMVVRAGMPTLPLGRDAHTTIPKQIRPKNSAEF